MTIERIRVESEDLKLILEGELEHGLLQAWACRGAGKGCKRNRFRKQAKHCDDCFGPLPGDMTLEQVKKRIVIGDS